MDGLPDRRGLREFLVIFAVGCIVTACAYGIATNAAGDDPVTEIIMILGLSAAAFFGPVMAFRQRARDKDHADARVRAHHSHLNEVLQNMSQGFCRFDADQRLIVANDQFARLYALHPDRVKPGMNLREILQARIANGLYAGGDPGAYIQKRLACVAAGEESLDIHELPDGRVLSLSHKPLPDGGWLTTHEDITELQKVEKQIAYMENFDPVTDLPNRRQFRNDIASRLESRTGAEKFAILHLDIDHFKSVNDTLGHAAGDKLLRLVGERLRKCLKAGDMVARLGGDEFAVVQASDNQPHQATVLASLICAVMKELVELDGNQIEAEVSIGIAVAPCDGLDPDQLIKNADLALHQAKGDGNGIYRFFESGLDARMAGRRELELDMRKAIGEDQFKVHYQPLVDAKTEEICGFEALLRWEHPEHGLMSPAEFIPLAEESGLIVALGKFVIRQACEEAMNWPDPVRVAVNVSAAQFKNANIVGSVMHALSRSGLAAQRLELEITESVLLADSDATLEMLHMLRNLGVRIAMDDFGTGYSSLSYLRSFPFDKIKLDGSFVRDLTNDADADEVLAIVRAVASLGNSLGMTTTAEGVETQEQLNMVRQEGYSEIQGYYYSRPLPAEQIAERYFPPEAMAVGGAA